MKQSNCASLEVMMWGVTPRVTTRNTEYSLIKMTHTNMDFMKHRNCLLCLIMNINSKKTKSFFSTNA